MEDAAYELMYESELNHWWDKGRRKIALSLIKKYSRASGMKQKILDLGCGTGAMAKEIEAIGEYYGVDVSERAVNLCKKRGIKNIEQGDALCIPHANDQFDVVLALDVIEHVKDDIGAIAEMRRVLRSGGTVIVTVPAFKFLWGPTDIFFHHYRRYRLHELKSKIERSGFSVFKSSYFNTFLFPPVFLVKLLMKGFHLPMKLENEVSRNVINDIWIVNKILYGIFFLESVLLKYVNFPFGISAVVIGRKD